MGQDYIHQGEILVVEDNPAHLDLLAQLLQNSGYRVRAVTSGERALQTAAVAAPDLVLLDVNMAGLDGYEVCRRFKQDPALKHVPVLFVSAAGDLLDVVAAFEVGAADYVTKPYQFPEVLGRVQVHLSRVLLERQLASCTRDLEAAKARAAALEGALRDLVGHLEGRRPSGDAAAETALDRLLASARRQLQAAEGA